MIRSRVTWLFTVAALLLVGGCDTSFEAFEETDRAYSVFGYLDANADTQFVRVEPIQDSTFVGSGVIDAQVTSEKLGSGEPVVWENRTFQVGTSNVTVHNVVTTTDLEPKAIYRFTIERQSDGATSIAEVTLPSAFPIPNILNPPDFSDPENPSDSPTLVHVDGVKRLGGVKARYDYDSCFFPPGSGDPVCRRQFTAVPHLSDTTRLGDGTLEVEIAWQADIPERQGAVLDTLRSFHVTVAAVSGDWPEYAEENPPGGGPEGQPLPPLGTESNIENGAGFLGGVFTRTVDVQIRR